MYCRKCRYCLQGLEGPACPECGRAFSAANRKTWDALPARSGLSMLFLLIGMGLYVGLIVVLSSRDIRPGGIFWLLDWQTCVATVAIAMIAGFWADRTGPQFILGIVAGTVLVLLQQSDDELVGRSVREVQWFRDGVCVVLAFAASIALARAGGWLGWRGRFALGRLIRARWLTTWRSKWYRPRNLMLGAVTAALLVAGSVFVSVLRIVGGEPTIAIDYAVPLEQQRAELTGVDLAEAHANWRELQSVMEQVGVWLREQEQQYLAASNGPRTEFSFEGLDFQLVVEGDDLPSMLDPERAVIRRLREEGLWEDIRQCASGPLPLRKLRLSSGNGAWAFDDLHLTTHRELHRIGRAAMRLDLAAGDIESFLEVFETLMQLGTALQWQGPWIGVATGSLCQWGLMEELQLLLQEYELPAEACKQLRAIVGRSAAPPLEFIHAYARADLDNAIQHAFSDDGDGDGYWLPAPAARIAGGATAVPPTGLDLWKQAYHARFRWPTRRAIVERCAAIIDGDEVGLDEQQREELLDTAFAGGTISDLMPGPTVMLVAADTLARIKTAPPSEAQARSQVRLQIAIEHYIAEHGAVPPDQSALVPRFMPSLPIDPITEQHFGYYVRGDGTYMIYSYGADRVDDGGRFDPEWRRRGEYEGESGYDVPLTDPRSDRD